MHRCYLPPDRWQDGVLIPDRQEAHHLCHVLRVGHGDPLEAFDGVGHRVHVRVARDGTGGSITLIPVGVTEEIPRPFPAVTLIQAIPKGTRMDSVVEKGTELGMTRLVPVMTDRTVTRLGAAKGRKRGERWTRIAQNAAKQCGAGWIPEIAPVQALADSLAQRRAGDVLLMGALSGAQRPMAKVVDELAAKRPPSISLLIGPEGDLTPAEMNDARARGAIGVSMGQLVLRTDTAALCGLSLLASRFRSGARRPAKL